jgi:DNA processing protein
VLSPFPPDEPARPWQFLERNAVVAALADAVVVVEAAERSGALNTAGWASGKIDVLAFPGDVDRPKAAGCNALIRDGATLVRHADDVLAALGVGAQPVLPLELPVGAAAADPMARAVLDTLAAGPATLDALIVAADAPAGAVLALLVRLELEGAVERRDAATYRLRR